MTYVKQHKKLLIIKKTWPRTYSSATTVTYDTLVRLIFLSFLIKKNTSQIRINRFTCIYKKSNSFFSYIPPIKVWFSNHSWFDTMFFIMLTSIVMHWSYQIMIGNIMNDKCHSECLKLKEESVMHLYYFEILAKIYKLCSLE